ncbi:MAG: hypothetical protein KBT56_04620 [Paraperlucidibaca sp.]|nr:hypothetical protein [Paraperlucidibaca sp.]
MDGTLIVGFIGFASGTFIGGLMAKSRAKSMVADTVTRLLVHGTEVVATHLAKANGGTVDSHRKDAASLMLKSSIDMNNRLDEDIRTRNIKRL